jgi:protein phosphatase
MNVTVGAKSDIGRARERNEDSFLIDAPLYAVADGMGGHRGGNVASAMALETLQEGTSGNQPATLIEKVKLANGRVLERGEAERDLQGMGTTLTAILADGDKAHLVHIGDSRAYLLRDGKFQQLTQDHTLVQRMVDEGRLTREEADHHPQRSILTKALGVDADAEPDPMTLDLLPGDRLLLCTDGLTGMVDEDTIREVLETEPDPQRASDLLVDRANEAGGEDNITVIVLDVGRGEASPEPVTKGGAARRASDGGGGGSASGSPGGTATMTQDRVRSDTTQLHFPQAGRAAMPAEDPERRRRWRKIAVWCAAITVLLVAAFVGVRTYVSDQWYVGDAEGRVAIYNGIPTRFLVFDLSHVQETTTLSSADAERLAPWRELHGGITAKSLADARTIVEQIRQDLQGPTRTNG